jgi:hypothetical protein
MSGIIPTGSHRPSYTEWKAARSAAKISGNPIPSISELREQLNNSFKDITNFVLFSSLVFRAKIWKLLNTRVIYLVLCALIYNLLLYLDAITLPSTNIDILTSVTFILWVNDSHIEVKKQIKIDYPYANYLENIVYICHEYGYICFDYFDSFY